MAQAQLPLLQSSCACEDQFLPQISVRINPHIALIFTYGSKVNSLLVVQDLVDSSRSDHIWWQNFKLSVRKGVSAARKPLYLYLRGDLKSAGQYQSLHP